MTRIDFYILAEAAALLPTAVKLCDKATQGRNKVFVRCSDASALNALDDLLWTQRQGSFLAHERFEGRAPSMPLPPVLIGHLDPPTEWQEVLINLSADVPSYFSRFERLCEIVGPDDESKAASRSRFKFYRDRGYELNTLRLGTDGSWQQA